ncbi:MAG TPA: NosD domain-containing protein, partial [archaeon]|nr:NosD domain-containing protein [archaeon]
PSGQTDCSGTCRNLQTDNSNCGSCGNACTGGTVCHQGQCLSSLSITSCGVLSTNGLTYVLTSDISDRSTALCMTIGANNVTLDCQGRKIDGVDSGVGVEIGTGRTGVKVENCVVSDWVYGIEVRGTASDNEVAGNVLKSNLGAGVRLEQTDGIPANNKFYNNWFANLQNVAFSGTQGSNAWSVQRTPGPNIAGGSFITGNFWETPYETGHSQTCSDANNDGVCDKNYKLNNSNTDASPLKAPKKQFFSCNSCESCSALLSQGKNVALSGVTQAVSAAGSCINWQVGSDADGDKTQILDCLGATIEKSSSTMILGPETTGISVGGTGAGVDLVVLKNCRVSGFTNGISISLDSGKDVRLLNNVLTENDNGITTSALHDLHLYFNTVIGSSKGLSEWLLDWLLGGWSSNYGLESYPRTLGVKDNCFCYHNKYDALAYYNDLEDASGNVCGVALDGEGGNVSLKFQGWSDPTGISSALANLLGGPYSYSNIPCDYTCDTSSLAPNTCLAAQNVLKESVCGDGVCDDSIETCASCEADCNRCDCPPSTYRCDGKCISYSADPQNCGGCKAEGEGENCLEKTRPLAGQQVPAPEVCWGPGSPNAYGTCGVFTCAVHDDCATLNIMNFVYKCCGNENATVFACTSVNSSASVLNCGACGNQCGSGGNAGRPYCCPSGGTFACSSAPCPPSLPDV